VLALAKKRQLVQLKSRLAIQRGPGQGSVPFDLKAKGRGYIGHNRDAAEPTQMIQSGLLAEYLYKYLWNAI
jgi:hypothetical protein